VKEFSVNTNFIRRVLLILTFLQTFYPATGFAVQVITYANGNVLRDAEGNIYNHLGEKFISTNGKMTYPSWMGGKPMRENTGWGSYPWTLYYPNGDKLVDYEYQVYYPRPPGATQTIKFADGWSYYYLNGQNVLSNNWHDAQTIYHSNSVKAWDGTAIRNAQNDVVPFQQIWERFGDWGYMYLLLDGRSGSFHLSSSFVFDLLRSSYVYPIIFGSNNGIPGPLFDKFSIRLETGYWGEVVTVFIDGSNVTSNFEQTGIPIPQPWPDPCTGAVLQHANRPVVMRDKPELNGFVRRPRR